MMPYTIQPRKQWLTERVHEILKAMAEVLSNGELPRHEWVDELSELLDLIEAEE